LSKPFSRKAKKLFR